MRVLDKRSRLLWTFFFFAIPLGFANANPVTIAFSFNSEPFSFDFGTGSTIQHGFFSYDDGNPISVFNGTGFLVTDFQLDLLNLEPARNTFWVPAPSFENSTIQTNGDIDDTWNLIDQRGILRFQLFAQPDGQGGFTGDITEEGITVPVSFRLSSVSIDIKPGNKKNKVNLRSSGRVWVAVLSGLETPFDPLQIKIPSIRFGPNEATAIGYRVRDVNRDRLGDLLFRFKIRMTGIVCGHTEATLIGETFDGLRFTGTDSIRIVGCKPNASRRSQ